MKKLNYLLCSIALFFSHSLFSSPEGDANYKIVASYFLDVLNGGKHELIDEIFSDDLRFVSGRGPGGIEVVDPFVKWFDEKNGRIEILEHIANEERVYIMFRLSFNWPEWAQASEKPKTDRLIRHARFNIENGKISEFRLTDSRLDQLKELSGFEGSFQEIVEALSSK